MMKNYRMIKKSQNDEKFRMMKKLQNDEKTLE